MDERLRFLLIAVWICVMVLIWTKTWRMSRQTEAIKSETEDIRKDIVASAMTLADKALATLDEANKDLDGMCERLDTLDDD